MSTSNNEITRIYYQVVKQSIKRRKLTKLKEASSLCFPQAAASFASKKSALLGLLFFLFFPSSRNHLLSLGYHPPSYSSISQHAFLQPPSWAAIPLASCPRLSSCMGWAPPSSTNVMKRSPKSFSQAPHFKRGLQILSKKTLNR